MGGEKATGVATPSGATSLPKLKRGKGWRVKGIEGGKFEVAMNRERLGKEVDQIKQGGNVRKKK